MNNAVLAAIFDTYNTGDYPVEIRSNIDATVDYFVKSTGEKSSQIDDKILTPISLVEAWSFEQGFRACLSMINGSLFKEDNTHEKIN